MLDFIALDFETANSYRGSPCTLGLVRVRNGKVVDESSILMRPPEPVDHFDGYNVAIHGITPAMVEHAPRWNEVLPALIEDIGDDIVVTHNAGFDIGVIRYACAASGIDWPAVRFLCTLVMSRHTLSLPSYRLPFVADALGFDMGYHHEPLADAKAAAELVVRLADRRSVGTLEALAESVGVCIGRMSAGSYRGSVTGGYGSAKDGSGLGGGRLVRPDLNREADPDGYLFGRTVVFTGALMSMTRQLAWEECARLGAIPEPSTTKRTNVLVIGDINPASLRPGAALTAKAEKVFALQHKGQEIEVMTEDDFIRCLGARSLT